MLRVSGLTLTVLILLCGIWIVITADEGTQTTSPPILEAPASVPAGETLQVVATVPPNGEVDVTIEFYIDGELVGSDDEMDPPQEDHNRASLDVPADAAGKTVKVVVTADNGTQTEQHVHVTAH